MPYCVNKSEQTNKLWTNLVSPPKYLNTSFSTFQPEIKTFLFLAFQFQMRIDVKRKACQLLANRTDNTQHFYILAVPVVKFSTISDLFSVLSCSSQFWHVCHTVWINLNNQTNKPQALPLKIIFIHLPAKRNFMAILPPHKPPRVLTLYEPP